MNKIEQFDEYLIDNTFDLNRIIKDFSPYVNTIINNMVGNKLSYEDKEEILLDTFFTLWKNKNNIKVSLNSYIAGITRNLVKEKFKNNKLMYDISDYENSIEISDINIYSEEREEIYKIEKSFKMLNELDMKIVNMFYYSSISIKDIAKELEISEFNVKTRLYRTRKKIKKALNIGG